MVIQGRVRFPLKPGLAGRGWGGGGGAYAAQQTTVEFQWLKHILGQWKFTRDVGSLSHCGLIIVPGREANSDNLGSSFDLLYNNSMLSVILVSTHNIQFHDKTGAIPRNMCV